APPRGAARERRVPAARRARDRPGARPRRDPAGRRRPRPQPEPERLRARRYGHAFARAVARADDRRRRARDVGGAPQTRLAREGARPRARAHDPPLDGVTPDPGGGQPTMRTLPIGDDRVATGSTGDDIVVRSPYDGHEIDRVPGCGADEVS